MANETEHHVRRSAESAEQAATQTAVAAQETKTSAVQTAVAAEKTKSSAERTVELAADRTVFAAERTYAAWVRTGLVALASGIGAKKLLEGVVPGWLIVATGSVLVAFSAFCFVAGVWRQTFVGTAPPEPNARQLPPAILVTVNAFLALVALAALFGVWFGRTGG